MSVIELKRKFRCRFFRYKFVLIAVAIAEMPTSVTRILLPTPLREIKFWFLWKKLKKEYQKSREIDLRNLLAISPWLRLEIPSSEMQLFVPSLNKWIVKIEAKNLLEVD